MSDSPFKLGIIVASVRPSRLGASIGHWVHQQSSQDDRFEVDLIDLADVALPFADEPHHPVTGNYVHEHTKAWSRRVAACHGFVIVTPEYNHGYPASIKNALDLVNREWWYKPVAFASYGGISGGLRSVQQLKQVVTFLRMIPVADAIVAPFFAKQIDKTGHFVPNDEQVASVTAVLNEVLAVGMPLQHLQQLSPVGG